MPSALCPARSHLIPHDGAYCLDCAVCHICKRQLSVIEYLYCVDRPRARTGPDSSTIYDYVFEHPSCFSEVDHLILANADVVIPQHLLDKLNAARGLLTPDIDKSIKTNSYDAEIRTHQYIHLMNGEELTLFLVRLEAIASVVSLALTKARRGEIVRELRKRDSERFAEAQKERAAPRTPRAAAKVERIIVTKEDRKVQQLVRLSGGALTFEEAKAVLARKAGTV